MPCSVKMFFGERLTAANGFQLFYSDPDEVHIENYDCTMISQALGMNFTSFTLSERELLSTASFQTWTSYAAVASLDGRNDIFGVKVLTSLLGADGFAKLVEDVDKGIINLVTKKDGGALNTHMNKLARESAREKIPKIEQAFKWIKNIHDTYYGRQYLIQVGDQNSGICIKDKFGNPAAYNLKAEEGGLYHTSDWPASGGSWPNPGVTTILGLDIGPETLLFHESDNRIGSFVKIDNYRDINKIGQTWEIDLSSCADDAFYKKGASLYLKSTISEAIYQYGGNQYVLLEVSGPPKLKLQSDGQICDANLMSQGAVAVMALFSQQYTEAGAALNDILCDNPDNDQDGTPSNRSSFNILKSNRPSITPDDFIIPMKSNLFVYGPWFYQANPVGGTLVENNKELCPWKFTDGYDDGYERMNTYGTLIAQDGPRGLQKQESGSITVAALPSYSLGYFVGTNAATLTDISISIGESGYTTTYNFQTYTPKFGNPGRALANIWSKNYQSLSYINKFFKDQAIELQKLINSKDTALQGAANKLFEVPRTADSPITMDEGADATTSGRTPGLMLLSGFMMRDQSGNASGGTDCHSGEAGDTIPCKTCEENTEPGPIGDASSSSNGNTLQNRGWTNLDKGTTWEWVKENTYQRMAIMTLDLLLTPISTKQEGDETAQLPRLALYQNYECAHMEFGDKPEDSSPGKPPHSRPRNEIPPFLLDESLSNDLQIHQMYLNAVTSENMLNTWDARTNGSTHGFITHLISTGNTFEDFKLTLSDEDETFRQSHTNFRYQALRGPLTLQAWGYDTSGKPIPNAIDDAALTEIGQFRRKGLKDQFLKNWLNNPKTWPAGPIDLRWDRERGVWVAPPANKIVVARLTQNLTKFGVAEAELMNPDGGGVSFYEYYDIWDKDGKNVKQSINKAKIKIYDYLGIELCKCDMVYAYYDDNRYIVLESSRAYKDPNEVCCPTTTPTPKISIPTQSTPTSCWCNLECLQTLKGFKEDKHQALVHRAETGGPDCLMWEDIVECYTPPPNFYENN